MLQDRPLQAWHAVVVIVALYVLTVILGIDEAWSFDCMTVDDIPGQTAACAGKPSKGKHAIKTLAINLAQDFMDLV
ncbi:hypothetical protein EDC26_10782 [Paralcaligenes ureilyticus]|uniref:Uncharacterized protein n=2 Tax=Paralcaligenes ureilyticus TaxID=627131 RepID=A0A4R3M2T3_9BURK|nr:hypothetical protein EDC26_10782 [Paralcaligenes ureilyticus]